MLVVLCTLGALLLAFYGVVGHSFFAPSAPATPSSSNTPKPQRTTPNTSTRTAPDTGRSPARAPLKKKRAQPAPQTDDAGCTLRVSTVCHEGDAWWVNSCNQIHEPFEDCGAQLCRQGACQNPPPEGCGEETAFGRCEGTVAHGCFAKKPYAIDCARAGFRCAITAEGAACVPSTPDDCDWPPGETQCEGQNLVACIDGSFHRIDCASQGTTCRVENDKARCYEPEKPADAPLELEEQCTDPCGCDDPARNTLAEICDGLDNNANGLIDEDIDCGPVEVVAFVVTDSSGNSSYSTQDIEAEISRVNTFFALGGHSPPLRFELVDIQKLSNTDWLELDSSEYHNIIARKTLYLNRAYFYIPIIFTDVVRTGGAPKLGVSTLPNGRCGGLRRGIGPQPLVGAIAVSKGRAPTTTAHEIGHFLGLCHTHEDRPGIVQRLIPRGDAAAWTSCESCQLEGDGLCDTPEDPGPSQCRYRGDTCEVFCEDEFEPDGWNLMSYYTSCRSAFTPEQILEIRHNLALRRSWHRCLDPAACACAPRPNVCPADMGCKPQGGQSAVPWSCTLQGSVAPAQACRGIGDCQANAICMRPGGGANRCVRLCDQSIEGCNCLLDIEGQPPVCREDLQNR